MEILKDKYLWIVVVAGFAVGYALGWFSYVIGEGPGISMEYTQILWGFGVAIIGGVIRIIVKGGQVASQLKIKSPKPRGLTPKELEGLDAANRPVGEKARPSTKKAK